MDDRPYRLLLHGFDTLQCAYYLHAKEDSIFDFRELAVNKEALQHRKSKDPEMIVIGEELFHLYPTALLRGIPSLSSRISRSSAGSSTILLSSSPSSQGLCSWRMSFT
jgi:hypothetical protein